MVDAVKVLFFKKEATYATDAAPTGAANAALTRNFTTKPVVVDRIQRNLDRPVRGSSKDAPSNERQTYGYELELAGSGAAGTAPAWMEHLEACGMAAPVLTANTSAVQRFAAIGAALSSATAYHWHGTQKRIGLGGRGTFGWDFTAGQYPFIKVDMTALLPAAGAIGDAAPGAVAFDQWKDPLEVNTTNTDFLLGGFAANLRSFTGEANAEITPRNLVGANYINRGNHGLTCRVVAECPAIGAKDYFTTLRKGDEIPVQLDHGTVAGNIIQFKSDHLQITDIELSDENNVLMITITGKLNVGTTPDDLIITAK
ncbi:hypothetical protein [Sphingomonas sp. 1185]|uniref:phage tail tube protein n=1 Tax=Sphingomonas sp. 1185 TaxID=3156411 RepID=UPI0033958EF6